MRSTWTPRPDTSVKCPSVTLLMRSLKLYARNGSTQLPGCAAGAAVAGVGCVMSASQGFGVGTDGRLAESEDHELGRLHRGDADLGDDHARVADLRRVGLRVALHEEGFAGRTAHQRAVPPHAGEERVDVPADRAPEQLV